MRTQAGGPHFKAVGYSAVDSLTSVELACRADGVDVVQQEAARAFNQVQKQHCVLVPSAKAKSALKVWAQLRALVHAVKRSLVRGGALPAELSKRLKRDHF